MQATTEYTTLYLINGTQLAIQQQSFQGEDRLQTTDGRTISTLYRVAIQLIHVLLRPGHHTAVVFDDGTSGRTDIYPYYTPPYISDELAQQLSAIKELCRILGMKTITVPNYSADDIIATLAKQAAAQAHHIHIITGTIDAAQLISSQVTVEIPAPLGKTNTILNPESVIKRYKVHPYQLPELYALIGNKTKNIPGVWTLDFTTATKLIQQYITIAGIYNNLDKLNKANRTLLQTHKQAAEISLKLTLINDSAPITFDPQEFRTTPPDIEALFSFIDKFELAPLVKSVRQLIQDMSQHSQLDASTSKRLTKNLQQSYFPKTAQPIEPVLITTLDDLNLLAKILNQSEEITISILTDDTGQYDPLKVNLMGIGIVLSEEIYDSQPNNPHSRGYYIPLWHEHKGILNVNQVRDMLHRPFINPNIKKVMFNGTFQLTVLARYNIAIYPLHMDVQLAEWMINPKTEFLELFKIARKLDYDITLSLIDRVTEYYLDHNAKPEIADLPIQAGAFHTVTNAIAIKHMATNAEKRLPKTNIQHTLLGKERTLLESLTQVEAPVIAVTALMQAHGIKLDLNELNKLRHTVEVQMERLAIKMEATANVSAEKVMNPKELNKILFDDLQLDPKDIRKTKTGYSLEQRELSKLTNQNPVVELIAEYRELQQIINNYLNILPNMLNPKTGRIHTTYSQTTANTGRFTSSNPNLQSIPKHSKYGKQIRRAFVAAPGHKLLAIDYSQIELRILAHRSKDFNLIEAFQLSRDVHTATAAILYNVPIAFVDEQMRDFAKKANFGLIYGMGAYGLSEQTGSSENQAHNFIEHYFAAIPAVKQYIDAEKQRALSQGFVQTEYDNIRDFPLLEAPWEETTGKSDLLRAAINMPIQGTAADILKKAMAACYEQLANRRFRTKIIQQVHDELIFEVPINEIDVVAPLMIETMENVQELSVPLVTEAEIGDNWLELEKIN